MAKMGEYLEQHARQRYLDFSARNGRRGWEEYLPPFGDELSSLVEKYEPGSDTALPAS